MSKIYKQFFKKCKNSCPDMMGIFVPDCNVCIKNELDKFMQNNISKSDIKTISSELLNSFKKQDKLELLKYITTPIIDDEIKNKKIYLLKLLLSHLNKDLIDLKFKI